jgi:hypothetical protein
MKQKFKQIIGDSFYQLIFVYTILIFLLSLNFFWKYTFHFEIFALILGAFGYFIINKKKDSEKEEKVSNKKLHYFILGLAIILILLFRIIPYIGNPTALGYDSGIYKYGIESFNANGFGVDAWVLGSLTPGFLYLMKALGSIFSVPSILTWIFILFNLLLGFSIYSFCKEYFNKRVALISLLVYAVSVIQFKVFTYMYYKNIIALSLMLWSLYFLKREGKYSRVLFIIFGALTGAMHRPTFFIFGLSYLAFTIWHHKQWKTNLVNGLSIIGLTSIFYIGFFKSSILPLISPVAQSFVSPGTSPGTFINFFTYQFSTLIYLPFALIGFVYLLKTKKFNMIFFWTIITAMIVYFQFFFFNRFIIHLDIALIILSGVGFSLVIEKKRKFGISLLILMLFSAGFVTFNEAKNTTPLIDDIELQEIEGLQNIPENAFVMATSSIYSPYVLGYSGRKTIAPGLFDYNQHNEQEWINFWTSQDLSEIKGFLDTYEKPLYVHIGKKQRNNLAQFNESDCFEIFSQNDNNFVYEYVC